MANLPDKPMSSVMLTRLKQFTAMSKFKVRLPLTRQSLQMRLYLHTQI